MHTTKSKKKINQQYQRASNQQSNNKTNTEGGSYKYLVIDQNISYVGLVNKTAVTKEYNTKVKRIWNSTISSVNKILAHNLFVVPVSTTAIGILIWTVDEIKEIDIKTSKQLTMSRNFHPNRDIDKLYLRR